MPNGHTAAFIAAAHSSLRLQMVEASTLIVYAGGYLSVVFLSVCLAAGLYYIAELVEEYTQLTKRIVSWISEVTLLLHVALLFWDKLPLVPVAVSAAAHVTYLQLLRSFPFFRLLSWEGLASIGLLAAANLAWARHFYHTWHSLEYIFGFLLVTTWLTPCILVLSLASTEHALPGGVGGLPHGGSGGTAGQPKKKASKGLLLSLMTWIRGKAAEVMPSSTDGGGARRATLKPHTV